MKQGFRLLANFLEKSGQLILVLCGLESAQLRNGFQKLREREIHDRWGSFCGLGRNLGVRSIQKRKQKQDRRGGGVLHSVIVTHWGVVGHQPIKRGISSLIRGLSSSAELKSVWLRLPRDASRLAE